MNEPQKRYKVLLINDLDNNIYVENMDTLESGKGLSAYILIDNKTGKIIREDKGFLIAARLAAGTEYVPNKCHYAFWEKYLATPADLPS